MRRVMGENALAEIKQRQAKGLSISSVAEEMGWTHKTVQRAFLSEDINRYRENRSREKRYQELTKEHLVARGHGRGKNSAEEKIQRLFNLGHTKQRVLTDLHLTEEDLVAINRRRRRDRVAPLRERRTYGQGVDPGVSISNGLEKMTHLLEIMSREYRSLVTVQSDWCVEWDAEAAAVQKGLVSFRRQVRTSHKGETHDATVNNK